MNHIQLLATHNSYHREVTLQERRWHSVLLAGPENYYYSHATLAHQAAAQSVRSFELDIWADPDGGNYATPLIRRLSGAPYPPQDLMAQSGAKVLHVADLDVGTTCYTLITCLEEVKAWSDAHPLHVPIPIMLEFKKATPVRLGSSKPISWNDTALLASLDDEIRSVIPTTQLLVPDDIRQDGKTLEESILTRGWPDLDSARGRIFFVMDDGPTTLGAVRNAYVEGGHSNLEGRVVFTQSAPGEADCAYQKLNTPNGGDDDDEAGNLVRIQEAVRKGYWVRTRADVPITTLLSNDTTGQREAALVSGAQMVSTDWPAMGMSARYGVDYMVGFEGGWGARCNPVNGDGVCDERTVLEPKEYYGN